MGETAQLRISDVRAALSFAADLAGCTDAGRFAEQVDALPGLIGADGALISGCRKWVVEQAVEVGDPRIYTPELLSAAGRHWREHPVMTRDVAATGREARRVSDFVPSRAWRRSALFNDFYRPLGMTKEISAQLAWGPAGSSCCLVLHRGGRDFDRRDMVLLELLAPHLRAARARVVTAPAPGKPSAPALAQALPITAREAEVLALLTAGRTNDGIAAALGISPNTVARHVEHVYAKLGVHTRVAAARAALDALPD